MNKKMKRKKQKHKNQPTQVKKSEKCIQSTKEPKGTSLWSDSAKEKFETQENEYSNERIKRSFVVGKCCRDLQNTIGRYKMSFKLNCLGNSSTENNLQECLRVTRILNHRKNFSISFPETEWIGFGVDVEIGFYQIGIQGCMVLDENSKLYSLMFRTVTIGNVESREFGVNPPIKLYGLKNGPDTVPVEALYYQSERPKYLNQIINGQALDSTGCECVCFNCVRKLIDIMLTNLDLWAFLDVSLTYALRKARLNEMKKWMEKEEEICTQWGVSTLRLSTGGSIGGSGVYDDWNRLRGFGACCIEYDLHGRPIPLSMHLEVSRR